MKWAVSMGCPQDKIPKESTIKSTLQKKLVLQQLLQKVNKKSYVEQTRMNILISKINKANGQVLSTTSKFLLPPEYQRFSKVSKLKAQIGATSKSIEKAVLEEEDLLSQVKDKSKFNYFFVYLMCFLIIFVLDIKKLELRKTLDDVKAQYYIFKAKSMQLAEEVQKETNLQSKISRVTPVKLDSSNDNDALTASALKSCLEELKSFYLEIDLYQSDGEFSEFFNFFHLCLHF